MRYSTKLPLGVGLIHTLWTHQMFMHLHSLYDLHTLVEVQCNSASNVVMCSKYATEYSITIRDCHMYLNLNVSFDSS